MTLVAVLCNPPLTNGQRTLSRVELATRLLGFKDLATVNLFSLPSHATGAIDDLGLTEEGWLGARDELAAGLQRANGVLLGYGMTPPAGPARAHFLEQIGWLRAQLAKGDSPCWQVGDGPRHPSRWQRWTSRAHPGVPFAEAVGRSLVLVRDDSVGTPH